jgi:SP family myo-inositol transporter-like MFS transporter 13
MYCSQLVSDPRYNEIKLMDRSSNLVVGATFLSLMRIASPAGVFGIYAVFCMISWAFCWICYPETSGRAFLSVY